MKAKKSFGQHFLNREEIAERIANSLTINNELGHPVLEVGPGKGMLTKYLLKQYPLLKVVEADVDMVNILHKYYPQLENRVISGDFLKVDLAAVFEGQSFSLIGNFPYNISSQIVFRMIKYRDIVPEMVGMFQKEMADRIIAKPGGKDYGIISVLAQAYYEGKTLFDVDKSCFTPPPKVQSAVIRLIRKENQDLGCDEGLFRQVVKTSFNQRRKMLRNTLKPLFPEGSTELEDVFFQKRPEQLSLADFVGVTQLLAKQTT
ncbi:16S rRNA (adenine(1518)-N(6)/adenine(1519)-N(6))-dimethyltransferase RsmA [Haliscomenobacter sp.]|uniref:16S rRNA (adenine(1518)-N(6)/adenine(1519)-N(6))- dimethyltransferase RsmA n=1 Tax=Haliscomenobacter sp. TaxID=2717303 RepID=UPI0035940538